MIQAPSNRPARLRLKAFELRIPQAEIARELGTARTYVSNILNGNVRSETMLDRIEALLAEAEAQTQEATV